MSTTFDSTKNDLLEMLKDIAKGNIQLPDFQRSWVWDDEHIKSIIASVSQSYPIGAVMVLQTGNENVKFKPRLVQGVPGSDNSGPEFLILDGQQRLTALFQALHSEKSVETCDINKNKIKRWYYIDMLISLDANMDREDTIIGVHEDHTSRNFRNEIVLDFSTTEKEYEACVFPLNKIFNSSEWRTAFSEYWKYDSEKIRLFNEFEKEIIKQFEKYSVPLIVLKRETPKVAVCQVFEKVNTLGVSLTVFELLTATFAIDNYDLRKDWKERYKRLKDIKVLEKIGSTDFLQAISLLATREKKLTAIERGTPEDRAPGISCKRKEILNLTLEEYQRWADVVEEGFRKTGRLLTIQKIFSGRDVPYKTQIVPLASIVAVIGDRADNDGVRKKLFQWYWCGVLGELYGSAIETRFAKDLVEVLDWIDEGEIPSTINDANFVPNRLLTLRTRNSAAYKGLYAILMLDGCLDFRSGEPVSIQTYFDEKIDIHHIFPKNWCGNNQVDLRISDSIINKTPISAKTNKIIGGNAPSEYLDKLQNRAGIETNRMDEILRSHVIDVDSIRNNDFELFFDKRKEELISRIERSMGKPVAREVQVDEDIELTEIENELIEDEG